MASKNLYLLYKESRYSSPWAVPRWANNPNSIPGWQNRTNIQAQLNKLYEQDRKLHEQIKRLQSMLIK